MGHNVDEVIHVPVGLHGTVALGPTTTRPAGRGDRDLNLSSTRFGLDIGGVVDSLRLQ